MLENSAQSNTWNWEGWNSEQFR